MFNRALQKFVERSLADVELGSATIDTFHGWALSRLQRAYRGELRLDARPTADRAQQERVTAIKKQLGLLAAIDEFVAQQETRMVTWLEGALAPYRAQDWIEAYRAASGPVVRRLVELRSRARTERDASTGRTAQRATEIHKVFHAAVARMTQYKDELLRLFTDRALLRKHLPRVSEEDLQTLADYQTTLQRKDASERRAGPWIHFDDLAPLMTLVVRKHGGLPDPQRDDTVDVYDHLMIDEAQDFGAVELRVLLSVVRSRTGVTVVGDTNQKIVPSADFIGWDALAAELGIEGAAVAHLEVAHRSTREIMAVADTLTGDTTSVGRSGPKPRLFRGDTPELVTARLVAEVARLAAEHERGHVAVVTHARATAKQLAATLSGALPSFAVRHGHNQSFAFEPGVTVTNAAQVKGLEFDAVVVVEPDEASYPSSSVDGRRRLYTVLTRAKSELLLLASREPSALLHSAVDGGLLDIVDSGAVPAFHDDADEPF